MLALTVLLGRFTGVIVLVTITPTGAPMAFTTALGFLSSGIGFLAYAREWRWVGKLMGSLAAALGAGTLIVYTVAQTFVIRGFYYDPANPVFSRGIGIDGRMSPNAAGCFIVLGLALWQIGARRPRFAGVLAGASVILGISLVALVSYGTGLRWTVAWWRFTGMAIHTSLGFMICALGLFAWAMGSLRNTRSATARTVPIFSVAGTLALVLGVVMLVTNEHRRETANAMTDALELENGIERFTSAMTLMETATRDYLVTGEARYLERRESYRAQALASVEGLNQLAADNEVQHRLVTTLTPLVRRKFALNDEQVRERPERVQSLIIPGSEPAEILNGLQTTTDALRAEAERRLSRLRTESAASERTARLVLLCGGVLTLWLVAMAFMLVHRAQRGLQQANDELEERVRRRTGELLTSAQHLRESEGRLRFLADTMPQLVWTMLRDGTVETLNRGWNNYLGLQTEAEALAAAMSAVHEEDRTAMNDELTRMLREGRSAGGELRLRRADGEYRWHLWRAHPERDVDGRIVRWVGTSTDIHEKKLAEARLEQSVTERTAELRASEARFRDAFHFAGIGMAIVGLDGGWLRVNRSVCEIVGYTEEELFSKTFQDITHPDDLATDLAHVGDLLAGRKRYYQMEKRYFHRNGQVVWIRLTASLVRDGAGAPLHFVSQIEDITERKRLEQNLAEARDQALEASRLKSEFLATMSHEIRTPMNGVIGMTSLLRDTPLTETQAEYVRTIESSGESLLTILNDILDYSKIEAGRIELEVATFDLRQCIEDALDLFAVAAAEKKIELLYLMGSGVPPHVAGDVTRLRQVLANLLSNALKFTEAGEIVVTIDAEPIGGRHRLDFSVKDTGMGIPPESMNRLFKSFSQVDASTTRRFGGTGLGLVISRRLAELMGGEMWAESTPDEGSTFHFSVIVDAKPQLVRHNWQATQPELQGRRLLVVDDSETNRRVVTGLAEAWGMKVREAATPKAALAALAQDASCDVAVLDMQMPEMDGEQLAAAIHALPACAQLPLVLLTSIGRRARGNDFAHSLWKPVKADALFSAISACVQPDTVTRRGVTPAPAYDATLGVRCPLQVLVAEDNAVNQKVVNLLLQRCGYRTTTVANGIEVIAAMDLKDYDVILMDVEMPELDGCEATRRIRATRNNAKRPWIVALTASAMQDDRNRATAAGMNDFLSKPLRPDALTDAMTRAYAALTAK